MKEFFKKAVFLLAFVCLTYSSFSANCTSGTSISGSGAKTISATSYIACGNSLSGNVTMSSASSIFCIDYCSSASLGTWTGTFASDPTSGSTVNVYGVVSSSSWSFSSAGATINVYSGGSLTLTGLSISGGTYTINNWGTMTVNGAFSTNGGTVNINNYSTMTVTGNFTSSNSGFTFDNKSGATINIQGATGLSISAGTFKNSGTTTVTNTLTVSGGTFTNSGTFNVKNVSSTGGTSTNSGIMYVSGNFSNSSLSWTNNSKIIVSGSITNNGTINNGSGAYWKGASWNNSGFIKGPASGCSVFSISGNTTNSGTISSGNSSHVDICDAGSPSGGVDANTGFLNSATFCSCYVLPISLLDFKAVPHGNKVKIEWQTATEVNNEFFTIERSVDGLQFNAVGTVKGAGNSSKALKYFIYDDQPLAGVTYYRLRQTDYDGKTEVFRPVAVNMNKTLIYPNPVLNELNVLVSSSEESATVSIFDISGKLILSENQKLNSGTSQVKINTSDFSRGTYLIRVETESDVFFDRFVK